MKKKKRQELSKSITQGMAHESGHLIAALFLEKEVKNIEFRVLQTKTQYLFVGAIPTDREQFKKNLEDPQKREKAILDRIAILYAGNNAHLLLFGLNNFPGGGVEDLKEICIILKDLVPAHRQEAVANAAADLSWKIITENQDKIKRVAGELAERFKRGENPARIEGPELEKIVGPFLPSPSREMIDLAEDQILRDFVRPPVLLPYEKMRANTGGV